MTTLSTASRKAKGTFFFVILLFIAAGGGAVFLLFFEGTAPVVQITGPESFIGADTTIVFSADDQQSGLRQVRLIITQQDKSQELFAASYQRTGYSGTVGLPREQQQIAFKPKEFGFTDGPAQLTLEAADYSARGFLKGNRTSLSREVVIDTTPPKIAVIHSERYVSPGGSGIVIYRLDDGDATSGLQVNDGYHPGFPVGDGRDDVYIAYFGVHFDAPGIDNSFVMAEDRAGNRTKTPFSMIFKGVNFKHDRIDVGDGFLDSKIPEFEQYYPEMQGSMIDKYLYTNNEVRQQNNRKISELCQNPGPERLWSGSFTRMSGSSRAGYADHRTYYYQDKPVDRQVHLGMDIASTQNADVKAAARGVVVYADYLGIYGNMVMLDHGQGVFSLYSHLSQISVAPGDAIDKGVVLGLTGTSGMAGGDHLHFSMLVNGIFVTPKEWWDQHWIDVTIEEPLTASRF